MSRRDEKTPDHEHEPLNPGTSADPPQKQPAGAAKGKKNDAALSGSQKSDLRGARCDRTPRGMTT